MIFNKPLKTKEAYTEIKEKIQNQLECYKHPKDLTEEDIRRLKENIKQFDKNVLDKIIKDSIKSDKPKQ